MSRDIPAAAAERIVIDLREMAKAEYMSAAMETVSSRRRVRIAQGDTYNRAAWEVAQAAGINPDVLAPIALTWGE